MFALIALLMAVVSSSSEETERRRRVQELTDLLRLAGSRGVLGVPIAAWEDGSRLVRIVTIDEIERIEESLDKHHFIDDTLASIESVLDKDRNDWAITLVYLDGHHQIRAVLQLEASEQDRSVSVIYLWGTHKESEHGSTFRTIGNPVVWRRIFWFLHDRNLLDKLDETEGIGNFYGDLLVVKDGTRAAIAEIDKNLWNWSSSEMEAFMQTLERSLSSYARAYYEMRQAVDRWDGQVSDFEHLAGQQRVQLFDELLERGRISEGDPLWEHRDLVRAALEGDESAIVFEDEPGLSGRNLNDAIEKIRDNEVEFIQDMFNWNDLRKDIENEADFGSILISHGVTCSRETTDRRNDNQFHIDRVGASSSDDPDYTFAYGIGEQDWRPYWNAESDPAHARSHARSHMRSRPSDPIGALPTLLAETGSEIGELAADAISKNTDLVFVWPGPAGAVFTIRSDTDALMGLADFVFISDFAGLLSDEQRAAWKERLGLQ